MNTQQKNTVFLDLFRTKSYGATGECHCGIMHYDACNQWDDDHNESALPQAMESAKAHPERYQFQDNAIEYLNFNGALFVVGCRCKMDEFVFQFLTEEKQRVLSFYKKTQDVLNVADVE